MFVELILYHYNIWIVKIQALFWSLKKPKPTTGKKEFLIVHYNPPLVFMATKSLEDDFKDVYINVVFPRREQNIVDTDADSPLTTIGIDSFDKEEIYQIVKNALSALRRIKVIS